METVRLRPIRTKTAPASTPVSPQFAPQEDEVEPMTPAGRVFSDPQFNCHILAIFGMKHPLDIQAFKEGIRDTFLTHKRFCSLVRKGERGELYWVRTQVNLDDHVIVPVVKDSEKNSANFVEDYVAKLAQAPPLDTVRPLWEFHVLNVKSGEAAANVVLRVHHSLGDGTSLMSFFLACTRRVDKPDSLPSIPSQNRKISKISQDGQDFTTQQRSKVSSTVFWRKFPLLIWRLLLVLWYTFLDVCIFTATSLWLDDSQTPIKGFPGVENAAKILAHSTVSLEDIRLVKQAIKGTVNDVMFGLLAAGLTSYLQQRYAEDAIQQNRELNSKGRPGDHASKIGEDLGKQKMKSLAHLRVRASALVNTRPSPGLHEMQDMMQGGSQARWGNHMGYIILPIPISEYKDPLEYARRAKSIIDKKKLSLEAPFTYTSGTLLMNLTGAEMPTKLTYRCASHATLSFSNMVGPLEEVEFFGNPITHIIPTVSGQPQSLCVHFQSYMGKVTMITFAAKDLIPDPARLCKYMECALQEMKQQALTVLAKNVD